jgi:hypothetical protein
MTLISLFLASYLIFNLNYAYIFDSKEDVLFMVFSKALGYFEGGNPRKSAYFSPKNILV